ncbi:hypothetical protein M5689_022681 [Euphorbia peplus]|nr:hypothetical protein M5689_022681 [Euphorbia peplus]
MEFNKVFFMIFLFEFLLLALPLGANHPADNVAPTTTGFIQGTIVTGSKLGGDGQMTAKSTSSKQIVSVERKGGGGGGRGGGGRAIGGSFRGGSRFGGSPGGNSSGGSGRSIGGSPGGPGREIGGSPGKGGRGGSPGKGGCGGSPGKGCRATGGSRGEAGGSPVFIPGYVAGVPYYHYNQNHHRHNSSGSGHRNLNTVALPSLLLVLLFVLCLLNI